MNITRHYLTIVEPQGKRRVHYRRCGIGPPLIMAHQSPRSSAEYEQQMRAWGKYFTCIAPDTPGFGQSDPLDIANPDIGDYADATAAFIRALGIEKTAAYGFHSGGIVLVTALKRHPELFTALGVGAYAIWTPEEMALFGERYLPEFHPSGYGEHLTWLWSRILEQSWFFPWFDLRDQARLSVAHANIDIVHATVMDMLDSGNAYRDGYGAVLRAPRDIPSVDANVPPCLITAYDGDPLQAHIDRLGDMPKGWSAKKVATPAEQQAESLSFLTDHAGAKLAEFASDDDAGFAAVTVDGFDGLIHWRGGGDTLHIHAPGRDSALAAKDGCITIDLPGHGLSDGWQSKAPTDWNVWQAVIDAAAEMLNCTEITFEALPAGEPDRLYPDLTPDRFGNYLSAAWQIVRASHFFAPWYEADAAHAIDFDTADIAPERLAAEHRALIRARSAKELHIALVQKEKLSL